MESDQTITYWIEQLKAEDTEAAAKLWDRYFEKIILLARRKLGNVPPRVIDAEDVAASVFHSLCFGAARGNFPLLSDRTDLWRLLVTITHQKAVDHLRKANAQKRGGGEVRGESVFAGADEGSNLAGIDGCEGQDTNPEFLVLMEDQIQYLISTLRSDELRKIAIARLEGKSNTEIGDEMRMSRRSVERKLRLIRDHWESELLKPE